MQHSADNRNVGVGDRQENYDVTSLPAEDRKGFVFTFQVLTYPYFSKNPFQGILDIMFEMLKAQFRLNQNF
jgi:hypothetical protein